MVVVGLTAWGFSAGVPRANYPPVLYVTDEFRHRCLDGADRRGSRLDGPPLWVRDVFGEPSGGCSGWMLWQFANRGRELVRVAGEGGAVGLDAA